MNVNLTKTLPALLLAGITLVGCASGGPRTQAGDYAGKGAGIGAGVGLFLGALTGDPDVAVSMAAVGAGTGAATGAYEGWHQDKADARTAQIVAAVKESRQQAAHPQVEGQYDEQLNRFLGNWQVKGWALEADEDKVRVQADARAILGMGQQVDLDFQQVAVNGKPSPQWGTATLAHDGTNFNLLSRFSTKDEINRLRGRFNRNNETFTFANDGSRIQIRFIGPDSFTLQTLAQTDHGERLVESYQFVRS